MSEKKSNERKREAMSDEQRVTTKIKENLPALRL
jgi:hypothetical protein